MNNLIEALGVFCKYGNVKRPTACIDGWLYINEYYSKNHMSPCDVKSLEKLGFYWSGDLGLFRSELYGSC